MKIFKNHAHFALLILVLVAVAAVVYAVAPDMRPYGVVTPRIYLGTYGDTATVANYYAVPPTLSANDTLTCNDATQTLTAKTLTTPTINTPSITFPTITGTATFAGGVTVDGTGNATQYGFKSTVESVAAATTVVTLTSADSGKTYFTGGSRTANVRLTLPDASPGLRYTFVVGADGAGGTIIDCQAADAIMFPDSAAAAAGVAYSCSTIGATMVAEAVDVTNWALTDAKPYTGWVRE